MLILSLFISENHFNDLNFLFIDSKFFNFEKVTGKTWYLKIIFLRHVFAPEPGDQLN